MKYCIIIIGLLISCGLFAKDFSSDWVNYKLPDNWKVKATKSVKYMPFAGKNSAGTIEFRYEADSVKQAIQYLVFEYPAKDSVLINKLNSYMLRQSRFEMIDISQPFLKSFVRNGFYYFLFPRPNFKLNEHKECQRLAKTLFEY